MLNYFIRRLLFVPITFVAITFMVYAVVRSAPGGPIQQLEQQLKGGGAGGGEASSGGGGIVDSGDMVLSDAAREELRQYYNLDKSIPVGYLEWLGVKPRDVRSAIDQKDRESEPEFWQAAYPLQREFDTKLEAFEKKLREEDWRSDGDRILVPVSAERRRSEGEFFEEADRLASLGVDRLSDLRDHLETRDYQRIDTRFYGPLTDLERESNPEYWSIVDAMSSERDTAKKDLDDHLGTESRIYSNDRFYDVERRFGGVLQGDFGYSTQKSKPALEAITDRFPISVYFGLIGYLATWLVCIPLGVIKAIRHRSVFDTVSSIVVFFGYAIPGFVACLILLVSVGKGSEWGFLPVGDFRSPGWDTKWDSGEYWWCIKDQVGRTIIPMFGYLVGSFATMTVLMKNSLLENLGADYVRTAFAKGLPERRVIFIHALRNSLIPITATIGYALGILFAGSFLIEKTCNIQGMGMLGLESITSRDYPVIMGILVFGVLIRLFGNVISDVIWALIDPRIRFK